MQHSACAVKLSAPHSALRQECTEFRHHGFPLRACVCSQAGMILSLRSRSNCRANIS